MFLHDAYFHVILYNDAVYYLLIGEGYPDDFFCYGLPGNTLPLGNWDPW